MNCMLTWTFKPEFGIVFTVSAVLHYITVCIYGYMAFEYEDVLYSVIYYLIHIILFMVCIAFNWKWTLLTSLIVIIGFLIAPDCVGLNIFMPNNSNIKGILFFHTIWFVAFIYITTILPVKLWIKVIIVIACIILHPVIDLCEGECMSIYDTTRNSFSKIIEALEH